VRLLAERALSQDLHEAIVRGGATDSIRWHVHLRQVVWAQVASLVIYTPAPPLHPPTHRDRSRDPDSGSIECTARNVKGLFGRDSDLSHALVADDHAMPRTATTGERTWADQRLARLSGWATTDATRPRGLSRGNYPPSLYRFVERRRGPG
jgi:hypothetical protein